MLGRQFVQDGNHGEFLMAHHLFSLFFFTSKILTHWGPKLVIGRLSDGFSAAICNPVILGEISDTDTPNWYLGCHSI
jgi:hypothetical protein